MEFSQIQPKLKKVNLKTEIKMEPDESPIIKEYFLDEFQNSVNVKIPQFEIKEIHEDPEKILTAIQIDHDYCASPIEQEDDEIYYEEVNLNEIEGTEVKLPRPSPKKPKLIDSLKCPHCSLVLENIMRYKRHLRLHQPPKHQCKNCFKWFKRESSIKNHGCDLKCFICPPGACVCSSDEITPENCKICRQIYFRYFSDYKQHMIQHHEIIIICNTCEAFNCTYNKHIKEEHVVEKYYKCSQCSKVFKTAELLDAHMEKHDKNFKCLTCNQKFLSKHSLQEHIRWHENPMIYHCKKCNRNFKGKYCLVNHLWRIHKKVYNSNYNKTVERKNLVNENGWYTCSYCPLNFQYSGNLAKHELQSHPKYHHPNLRTKELVNKLKSKVNESK